MTVYRFSIQSNVTHFIVNVNVHCVNRNIRLGYDPVTNTWTKVVPMLNRRCRLGVATLNGKLYACGGMLLVHLFKQFSHKFTCKGYDGNQFLRSVEMYDPNKDAWKLVAAMNVKRSRVALSANMGKLWAIGGYDGESNLSTVEVYDPEADSWTFVASMCAHGGGVGVRIFFLYFGVIFAIEENIFLYFQAGVIPMT